MSVKTGPWASVPSLLHVMTSKTVLDGRLFSTFMTVMTVMRTCGPREETLCHVTDITDKGGGIYATLLTLMTVLA